MHFVTVICQDQYALCNGNIMTGSVCEQIISLTTSSLLNLLSSDEFTILADTWLTISRSHPPHPMESLPHKLLDKLLQLFRY